MLSIHVLNVDHGDCIVLEHRDRDASSFALIDSNIRRGQAQSPAVGKLRSLGAERLNFVVLTHPHADHYRGMLEVLQAFRGRIDDFYCFPSELHTRPRFEKLAKQFSAVAARTEDAALQNAEEFIGILLEIKKHITLDRTTEPRGPGAPLLNTGFLGAEFFTILPPARMRGFMIQALEKEA